LVVACLLGCTGVARATVADDLCAPNADPCVVNGTVVLAPGSAIDLGTRALHVGAQGRLVLSGVVTIDAGPVRLLPGARVLGTGGDFGPSLTLRSAGGITVEVAGSARARVDLSAALAAGAIRLTAAGNVAIDGDLISNGTGQEGSGGVVAVDAGGSIGITGFIEVKGGSDADGGGIAMRAGGSIDAAQVLSAAGGDFGGGTIDLEAAGDVVTRQKLDVPGGGVSGYGGYVQLDAGGSVSVLGVINGPGVGDPDEGGGSGADVDISAQQAITIAAVMTITGALPDGEGGSVTLDAGTNVTQTAAIIATGNGIDGCGGAVDVTAGRDVRLDRIDLGGGSCGGGTLWAQGLGTVTAAGLVTADGATQFGTGGFVTLQGRDVVTSAVIRANGSASGLAGTISVNGCRVTVGATSELRTLGPNGLNEILGGGRITVAGRMTASLGGVNAIRFRDALLPPIVSGVVVPVAVPVLDPLLPPCAPDGAACGNGTTEPGEECDDGNNVACDGCAASCRQETCGNARVECDEECDVGAENGAPGSPCDAACVVVPAAGGVQRLAGGTGRNACYAEWMVRNPGGEVVDGVPSHTQRCVDGDPACDQDGASDGQCLFEVGMCLSATDVRVPSCQPTAIEWVSLNVPNPLLVTAPHDVANAAALVAALGATGVTVRAGTNVVVAGHPVTQRDACTAPAAVRVPHPPAVAGTTQLLAAAREIDGGRMRRNRVDLVCDPNTAVCGNGVPEIGEGCDDGNTTSCDGCNAACRPEACGDGVVTCGEQCDDGAANGTPDSTCSAGCAEVVPAVRIPGGGSRLSDCQLETALYLASPALDGKGLPSTKQSCTDGDPGCDRDPAPGRCGFAMWACVAGDDARIGCGAVHVASLEVRRPSTRDTGTLAAIRAVLLQGVGAFVATGPGEVCSGRMVLGVPAGKSWTKLQLRTRDAAGRPDTDSLKLRCLAPR
jgi:cysteine-rich repeat protein